MSPTFKRKYILTIRLRYAQASRAAKSQILNEFCATTGYHRKAAIRVLTGPPPRPHRRRAPQPTYTERTVQLLKAIWRWICSPSSAFTTAQMALASAARCLRGRSQFGTTNNLSGP